MQAFNKTMTITILKKKCRKGIKKNWATCPLEKE